MAVSISDWDHWLHVSNSFHFSLKSLASFIRVMDYLIKLMGFLINGMATPISYLLESWFPCIESIDILTKLFSLYTGLPPPFMIEIIDIMYQTQSISPYNHRFPLSGSWLLLLIWWVSLYMGWPPPVLIKIMSLMFWKHCFPYWNKMCPYAHDGHLHLWLK